MPDLVDFLPLVTETVASIRNRVDADINAGLSVTDADYVDTVEGGTTWGSRWACLGRTRWPRRGR
jgi:hypothetical protein